MCSRQVYAWRFCLACCTSSFHLWFKAGFCMQHESHDVCKSFHTLDFCTWYSKLCMLAERARNLQGNALDLWIVRMVIEDAWSMYSDAFDLADLCKGLLKQPLSASLTSSPSAETSSNRLLMSSYVFTVCRNFFKSSSNILWPLHRQQKLLLTVF